MIKDIIKNSDYVIITSGAGMGADSGLATFRGDKGMWKTSSGKSKSYMEMANPKLFFKDPNEAWGFYGDRYNVYKKTKPHKGFDILKQLVDTKKGYFIFTSNVDGHFQKAGFDENKIVECHGTINYFQCINNCTDEIWTENLNIKVDKLIAKNPLPKCKNCGGIARPNILMFGDDYWNSKRTDEQIDRMTDFMSKINDKTVIIEIGAGLEVPTVRSKGEVLSLRYRIPLIRINPIDLDAHLPCTMIPVKMNGLEGIEYITKDFMSDKIFNKLDKQIERDEKTKEIFAKIDSQIEEVFGEEEEEITITKKDLKDIIESETDRIYKRIAEAGIYKDRRKKELKEYKEE